MTAPVTSTITSAIPSTITTASPVDGSVLATYPAMGAEQIEAAVAKGASAAAAWGRVPVPERAALLGRLVARLRAETERYAVLVTSEMGKPLAEARAEVE